MSHHVTTVKEDVGIAMKGFSILLFITFGEVFIALIGNGHITESIKLWKIVMIPAMTLLSLYKAYYIVGTFMHLGHETRPMAASVVLPMLLFVWAITAFLWEGDSWRTNQNYVNDKNEESAKPDAKSTSGDESKKPHGSILKKSDEISTEVSFH